MTAMVNFVDSQTSAVSQLASVGNKYLIINKNSPSLSGNHLNWETADAVNVSGVKSFFPQKLVEGTLEAGSGRFAVSVRGVENVADYLKFQAASVNGTAAADSSEVDVGVLLAEICSIKVQDMVAVSGGNVTLNLKVSGIIRTQTQLDSQLLAPLETAYALTQNSSLSFIEFSFKDGVNRQTALNSLSVQLPQEASVVKVQQTSQFMQRSVGETLNFLAVWSVTVYCVVAASSYVVATRLIVDSDYELAVLRSIGARKPRVFFVVFSFCVLVALAGSLLGVALGLAGTQVASAALRWLWQSVQVDTFLEPMQVGQILLFSTVFSAVGCVYPAFKSMRRRL